MIGTVVLFGVFQPSADFPQEHDHSPGIPNISKVCFLQWAQMGYTVETVTKGRSMAARGMALGNARVSMRSCSFVVA